MSALPYAKESLCRTLTKLKESPDSERRKHHQERWAILEAAAGLQGRTAPRKISSRLDGSKRERYESEGMKEVGRRGDISGGVSSLSATGRLSLAFLGTKEKSQKVSRSVLERYLEEGGEARFGEEKRGEN